MVWTDVMDDPKWGHHWSSKVDGIKFGSDDKVWYIPEAPGLTDSGSSCITAPSDYVDFISQNLLRNISRTKITSTGDYFNCSDASSLPSISIRFGGYFFEVPASDYLLVDDTTGECSLCILKLSGSNFW